MILEVLVFLDGLPKHLSRYHPSQFLVGAVAELQLRPLTVAREVVESIGFID